FFQNDDDNANEKEINSNYNITILVEKLPATHDNTADNAKKYIIKRKNIVQLRFKTVKQGRVPLPDVGLSPLSTLTDSTSACVTSAYTNLCRITERVHLKAEIHIFNTLKTDIVIRFGTFNFNAQTSTKCRNMKQGVKRSQER
ncbi:unnamed protein product, partial [Didymodactylos carnosus]